MTVREANFSNKTPDNSFLEINLNFRISKNKKDTKFFADIYGCLNYNLSKI